MDTQTLPATYTSKNVFGLPSTAKVEKYQGAHDALGRRVLELYFADCPDLISVYPYDTVTERNLKTVGITCIKTGWLLDGKPFDSGTFYPVNWAIKYRRDKMNDYQLIEVVDMAKKPEVSEADELKRQIEVLKTNKGFTMYGPETQIKVQGLLLAKFDASSWEALTKSPLYTRDLALTEMGLIIDRHLADMNSIPQITQDQLDRDIAASVGMTPDGKPLPTVEKSDFDILSQLKSADVKTDLTPSPDVGRVDELGAYLERLPNGAPNPDPKPPVEINATPSVNGKEAPEQKTMSTETEVSKIEASTPVSEKPLTADDWKTWEKEQADNLSIEIKDVRALLGITPEHTYRSYTTLADASKDLKIALDTRKMMDGAKKIFADFGVPPEIGATWITESIDASVGETLEEVAENWRTAESFLARLKSKAVEYEAAQGNKALATIEDKPMALTVPALPMRTIKMPTMEELGMMQTFAKAVSASKLYKEIDSVDKALVILWKGFELGVSFGAALDGIYIINGKPWPGAQILKAVVDASGLAEKFDIINDGRVCTVTVKRKGRDSINVHTYSMDEARTAGLADKDIWKKNAKRMLTHRAVRAAVMTDFPDIAAGIGMDFDEDEAA